MFRTRFDAELTAAIFERLPIPVMESRMSVESTIQLQGTLYGECCAGSYPPHKLIGSQSEGAMRGSRIAGGRTGRRSELSQIDVLLYLVESRPGRSALELSQAIYGDEASELRVRQDLGRLVSSGEIECRTNGSLKHPPSYFPIPLRRQE